MKRNQALVEAAFSLHQSGAILPDSYVIDVDTFLANGKQILDRAKNHDMRLYFMLKQVGRNPYLAKELVKLGYPGAVAVDFKEARVMMEHRIPIGNIGHLVQVPEAMVKEVVAYRPEVITVYSPEKICRINQAAGELGLNQGIMLRVYQEQDMIYSGQTAGFDLDRLAGLAAWIKQECPYVSVKGITSFPCYLYDEQQQDIFPTNNLKTVLEGAAVLREMGFSDLIINTPSATCVRTIEKMAENGGNCGEPGHGLSGTTPMHMYRELEEVPGVVYVSEISHNFKGRAYCYGGGHYRRSHAANALVGKALNQAGLAPVILPSDESIDYHFGIGQECCIGDTVIMAFRFQIFVTRSDVVLVKGLHQGRPEVAGIYDSQGRKKD